MLYPMCTVGIVFNSYDCRGNGVRVGPNLQLTAGHVAPWGPPIGALEFVRAGQMCPSTPAGRCGGYVTVFHVSVPTAARWAARYRELVAAGMRGLSSRPASWRGGPCDAGNGAAWHSGKNTRRGPAKITYLPGLTRPQAESSDAMNTPAHRTYTNDAPPPGIRLPNRTPPPRAMIERSIAWL